MMKTTYKNILNRQPFAGFPNIILFIVIAGMIAMLASCDTASDSGSSGVPEITGVRHIDPDSAATSQLNQVGPGETFVIEGRNLRSTRRAYFNGLQAAFNPTMVTGTHMIISVPGNMPFGILDPESPEMNTIKLVSDGGEVVFDFPILPPAPQIERVSKEFATEGETMRITGRYLYLVEEVTFPGGIQSTQFNFSEDGSWLEVVVPPGVMEAGHVNVTTASGTTADSYRNMFNDRTGIFIDYDELNPYTPWGTPGVNAPYVGTDVPGIPPLDGNYIHWFYDDPLTPGMWWFQDLATPHANWAGLTFPDYPENTPISELVFRMEIFTPHDKFESGYIQLSFDGPIENHWNPFIVDGERKPLTTDGWETVTLELTDFDDEDSPPGNYGPFKNSGEFFLRYVNPGEPDGAAFEEVNIAFDNLRIVQKF